MSVKTDHDITQQAADAVAAAMDSQRACVEVMESARRSLAAKLNDAEARIRRLEDAPPWWPEIAAAVGRPVAHWNDALDAIKELRRERDELRKAGAK